MKKILSFVLLCATVMFASCSKDDAPTLVEKVSLDKTTLTIGVGGTATLKATITPANASLQDISWISCDNSIATVSDQGEVKGVSAGEAVISAITASEGKIASCVVTVTAPTGVAEWANGNLVADGANSAKIGNPTEIGLYFRYGSLVGWSETGEDPTIAVAPVGCTVTSWTSTWVGDTTIDDAVAGKGDPCRYYLKGTWRLPTKEEYAKLFEGGYSSNGWKWENSAITNSTLGMTFPASGSRYIYTGKLEEVGKEGYYWTSSLYSEGMGYTLFFDSSSLESNDYDYIDSGLPVRCVQDK